MSTSNNINTTTPVAQYQFSNAELVHMRSSLENSNKETPYAKTEQLIQTINSILAARNSRG